MRCVVAVQRVLLAASVALLIHGADGWLITTLPFCRRPLQAAPGNKVRTSGSRWLAQMNPVEKLASNVRDAVAGVGAKDESYHEERIKYHEERIRHHQERMTFHRQELSSKKTARKESAGGGFEERLRIQALSQDRPMQILFVDLANTCRSPVAEAMMRMMLERVGLDHEIIVRSAGTGAGTRDWYKQDVAEEIEQERVDPRMVTHASRRGLNIAGRRSVVLVKSELQSADMIIVMEKSNEKQVQAAAGYWGVNLGNKVRLLTEYCRSGTITTDIPDPYYGGGSDKSSGQVFEKVLDLVEDGCKGLLRDCAPTAL